MNEEKYSEILSTVDANQIEPDAGQQTGPYKNIMIECRICLQELGPFIIPCKCDGTMKYVHEKCLKKWAAERLKRQVQKEEQRAKAKLSNIHGIECELCKETISMEVKKLKRLVGCSEAKQSSEDYFLPFVPLVIFNTTIFLGCLGGAIYILAFGIMLGFYSEDIQYEKYSQNLQMIWALLGLGFVFCSIFMGKSIIELYYIFIREEHEVIKVIPNPNIMKDLPKITQPDCPNTQWFSNMEPLSTPTSPHSVSDHLLQSKYSLTRKNFTLKRQIAKQIAERKKAKLPQFKANDQNTNNVEENSVTNFASKKLEIISPEQDVIA